jgi:hypothetical protein
MRIVIVATKVLRKTSGRPAKVGITILQPILLGVAGVALAGRRASAAMALTLCLLAAPRNDSQFSRIGLWTIGLALSGGTALLVEKKVKPKRGWLGYWPYFVALAAVLAAIPYVFSKQPQGVWGWAFLPAVASGLSAVMLFFWMNQVVNYTLCTLTAFAFWLCSRAAQEHNEKSTTWIDRAWPLRTMWVVWLVLVLGIPLAISFFPTCWLKKWKLEEVDQAVPMAQA